MIKKMSLGFISFIIVFFGFVVTKESKFNYERSGLIDADPGQVFPFISHLRLGGLWSPYEKIDPTMKKTFSGPDSDVGSIMEFQGNAQAGSGSLEILRIVPRQLVELKLTMKEPFYAENIVTYKLTPEGSQTRFTWSMSGDGGFMGKLISTFIDPEKMVGDQFTLGIANLKTLVEAEKNYHGSH